MNTASDTTKTMCPFCPLLLPEQPDLWNPAGNDFYGQPVLVHGHPACEACAISILEVGEYTSSEVEWLLS